MSMVPVKDFNLHEPGGPSVSLWLVYDGRVKVCERRGPAITRLLHSHWRPTESKLFEWVPDEGWKLRAHVDPDRTNDVCDHCGQTTLVPHPYSPGQTDDGKWVFERRRRKIVEPLNLMFLCVPCQDQLT